MSKPKSQTDIERSNSSGARRAREKSVGSRLDTASAYQWSGNRCEDANKSNSPPIAVT